MFNGSGCSVGRGSYAGEREGDCSATAPARWRAKATLAVCVLAAFSSQPQHDWSWQKKNLVFPKKSGDRTPVLSLDN